MTTFIPLSVMPWVIVRGQEFAREFQVVDENGSAVSLIGSTITGTIRSQRTLSGGSLVATLTIESVDLANGWIRYKLTSTATTALTATQFAGYGEIWVTCAATNNAPVLVLEAHPVSIQ